MGFGLSIPVAVTHGVPLTIDIDTGDATALLFAARVDAGAASTFGVQVYKCPIGPSSGAVEDVGMATGQIAKGASAGGDAPYVGFGVLRLVLTDGGGNSSGVVEVSGR